MFVDNHVGGSYYPAGSTLFLPGMLEKAIEEHGGDMRYNSEVVSILFEGGKPCGVLLAGLDNGINYLFDEEERILTHSLPFDPVSDPALMEELQATDSGVQFSHTFEEQVGGQLKAGLVLTHLFEDYNGAGRLHELHIPTFVATRAVKPKG